MQAQTSIAQTGRGPIAILGVPFDNVTMDETLAAIGEMVATRQPHYAATVPVDFLLQAQEEVELRRILFDAHLVLAEEKSQLWAAKILGNPLSERITVASLVPRLLALAAQKKWLVFLLGDTEAGLAGAGQKIRQLQPQLSVAGAYSPPAQALLEMDPMDILRRLREAKPDILLVAFGCPKQEKWINMNYREAGVPFTLGVGADFDSVLVTAARKKNRSALNLWNFSRAVLRQRWELRAGKTIAPTVAVEVIPDPYGNFVIRAPARLGAVEAQAMQGEWLRAVENGHTMFDLSDTVFTDSTGIGALIRLRRRARELGYQFILVAARPAIEAALKLMKLDEFFTMQASLAGARMLMESAARAPVVTSGVQEKELQIRWTGEVTALNAVELGVYTESELSQISPGMNVVIDLSRVTFVDSTGIGLMLRLKKNLARRGLTLQFQNPSAAVRNVLAHTRLEEYLLGEKK